MSFVFAGKVARFVFVSIVGLATVFSTSCRGEVREGFALYLTKGDMPTTPGDSLDRLELEDEPLLSSKDVVTYNTQTHELKLSDTAFERVAALSVPVSGRPFAVCIDRSPIYQGAWWTPISSMSFGGVVAMKPLASQEPKIITFELGYPSSQFYNGTDPRVDVRIMDSLRRAGKLVEHLSIDSVQRLPRSSKGYELYSWSNGGTWHFRLITGTNRTKTFSEIVSGEDFISETGWVSIGTSKVETIESALRKLQDSESAVWLNSVPADSAMGAVAFGMPPGATIDRLKTAAGSCGVALTIGR